MNFQGELSERYSVASESGSSTDSHAETPEIKDGESLFSFFIFQFGAAVSIWTQKKMFSKIKSRILLRFPSTVKKKYCAGLKFSNLMNIGKKKPSSLENPEKCVDTSGEKRSTAHVRPNDKIPKHALIVPQVRLLSFDTVTFCSAALAGRSLWGVICCQTKHVNI